MHSDFTCPNCHSENVQSLPIIYQSGTSGGDSVTQTGNIISVTKGVQMTNLARSVAPPTKKEASWGIVVFFGVLTFFALDSGSTVFLLCSAIVLAGGIYSNIEVSNYNEKVWPAEYDTWLHSYLCHRCGNVFVRK